MRKILFVLILVLLSTSAFANPSYAPQYMKEFSVNGFVKSYCNANIRPIENSSNTAIGMPFDITGDDIKLKSDLRLGREIARWDIATNLDNVRITFNITPLVSEVGQPEIDYYLTFRLAYDTVNSGILSTVIDYQTFLSDSLDHVVTISNRDDDIVLPVISLDQDIRFMLAEDYSNEIDSWPSGFYYSTVTITLEGT